MRTNTTLLDRLRQAVAPDYEVERELASGGMGTVFLGRDVALERPVAIKVLRPELATASFTERFLREARTLASLNHPNIVAIHRAGETDGLCWFVMDFLAAETLADRLVRGPLPAAGAVATALGVLAALDAAHRHGVVHRDVKPANVFLVEGRAVLSDFGIASSATSGGEPLTIPGQALGTPDYMAPEQMVGRPTSPATDLCGVGLLLFEALTGQRFESWERPERADWSRVPRRLVPVLRRALAVDPEARWPDAAAFAHAIRRAGRPVRARRILWSASAISLATAGVALWIGPCPGPVPAAPRELIIRPFHVTGPGAPPWLGDSLAHALVASLGANTDFRARVAASAGDTAGGQVLDGEATVRGDSLHLAIASARPATGLQGIRADTAGTTAGWDRAAGALAYQLLLRLWSRRDGAAALELPLGAAPRTGAGLHAFLDAERLFAHAQWDSAYHAYDRAGTLDPTCLICDVRAVDVSRWLGMPRDTVRTHRYRAALDSFPPQYRLLLRASFEPPVERLATLRQLTEAYRDWGFGWFLLGDEIFHRGPLVGRRRADALPLFEHASLLRPDFAPIWEHLAWEAIEEGHDSVALHALREYRGLASTGDPAATTIQALLRTGYMWRFRPAASAAAFTDTLLRDPRIAGYPHLGAGATYLLSFEVPRAAVWLGERFAQGRPQAGLEERGLLAQVLGLVALGRADSALAVARRVAARAAEPGVQLFAAELPAALALADSDDVALAWHALAPPLEAFASGVVAASAHERARAAWMLALLAARARRGADAEARYRRVIHAAGAEAEPLARFDSVVLGPAGHGFTGTALRRSAPLEALDSANGGGDAFYRMLLHLQRAGWQVQAGQPELAVRELRWHENNDFVGYPGPGEPPQGAEVDYAFATLARWYRARLLRTLGPAYRDEACDVLGNVARVWRDGEPRYAARADTARAALVALGCGASP